MFLFSIPSGLGKLPNFSWSFDLFTFGSNLHRRSHNDLYCFVNYFLWLLKLTHWGTSLLLLGSLPIIYLAMCNKYWVGFLFFELFSVRPFQFNNHWRQDWFNASAVWSSATQFVFLHSFKAAHSKPTLWQEYFHS